MADFDWVRPEIEQIYKSFNRVYSRSLKEEFAFIKYISISPQDFNNIFIDNEKWMIYLKVYICVDFNHKSFDSNKTPKEFGSRVVENLNHVISVFSNVPEIKEKYVSGEYILNNKEFCDKLPQQKETIKEEKENKIPEKLRRRLDGLDSGINYLLHTYYTNKDICERYVYDEYVQVVSDAIAERMYYVYFSDLDDTGEEWYEIYTGIMNYIESKWEDRLIGIYNRTCGKEENINEDISDRVRDRFYSFLNNNSLMTAISFFGHDKVSEILDEVEISKEDRINFIKDVIHEYGPLSVFDLNEDPIHYGRTKDEYREIHYFGKTRVDVKVWDEYFNDQGDFDVSYEALDDSSIHDIFEMLYEYHEEENRNNK